MSKGKRIERHRAQAIAEALTKELQRDGTRIVVGGSLRRGKPTIGDVDLVAVCKNEAARSTLNDTLGELFGYCKTKRKRAKRFGTFRDVAINVFDCLPHEQGAAVLFCTVCGVFNVKMRVIAKSRGLLLNQNGLYERCTREPVVDATEEETIFEALRLPYFKPTDRTEEALSW